MAFMNAAVKLLFRTFMFARETLTTPTLPAGMGDVARACALCAADAAWEEAATASLVAERADKTLTRF